MLKTVIERIGYRLLIIAMVAGLIFTVNVSDPVNIVKQGVINDASVVLADKVIDLNGEWEFYPDQLLTPQDFARRKYSASFITVPGSWSRQYIDGGKYPEDLCGTYRLKIMTPRSVGQVFALSTNVIRSSYQVFINGQSAGQVGIPGKTATTTVAGLRPGTYFFAARLENEIIIQVANFVNSKRGGIVSPINFGTAVAIDAERTNSVIADVVTATLFALVLAIFFGQYFQRNKELELLWFSSFCLFTLIMYMTTNNRLLLFLQPELPYEIFVRIAYVAVNWSVFSALLYVRTALKIRQQFTVYFITAITIILSIMIISLPLVIFTSYLVYLFMWYIFVCAVLVGFAGYGIYMQTDGYEHLTLGVVLFVLMAAATLFDYMNILNSNWYIATVSGLFLISQLLFITDRYRLTLLKRQQEAFELKYLRAQIKPHFIFNALGSIAGLMLEDVGAARKTLSDFSRYLRGMFRKENLSSQVLVEEELQLTEYYLHIEKVRYGDRLNVFIDVPDEVRQQQLPPLTLQPIAENCVKHGFVDSNSSVEIKICGLIKNNKTIITIEDNGTGISADKLQEILSGKSTGIGLTSTIARLQRSGGNLELFSSATGLKVIITL
ncbi:MAG: histidine kinase [Bacillota bacterium]